MPLRQATGAVTSSSRSRQRTAFARARPSAKARLFRTPSQTMFPGDSARNARAMAWPRAPLAPVTRITRGLIPMDLNSEIWDLKSQTGRQWPADCNPPHSRLPPGAGAGAECQWPRRIARPRPPPVPRPKSISATISSRANRARPRVPPRHRSAALEWRHTADVRVAPLDVLRAAVSPPARDLVRAGTDAIG